jgi:hypothetical protein
VASYELKGHHSIGRVRAAFNHLRNHFGGWKAAAIPPAARRTSARNLVRAGVAEHWAMPLCGHKTPEVFRRYAVTSEADLNEAVARLANLSGGSLATTLPLKGAKVLFAWISRYFVGAIVG